MNNVEKEKRISLNELIGEITDMLNVCFEGKAEICGETITLSMVNGQKFHIKLSTDKDF